MEILIIGAIFFAIALIVRRKEAFRFRWQPTQHMWEMRNPMAAMFAWQSNVDCRTVSGVG